MLAYEKGLEGTRGMARDNLGALHSRVCDSALLQYVENTFAAYSHYHVYHKSQYLFTNP